MSSNVSPDFDPPALTMLVQVPVQTVSPRWLTRHGLEDVEAHPAAVRDVLDRCGGGDLVAGHDERAPAELLAAVDHVGEVHPHLGVEQRAGHRPAGVDDGEHRRRDDVGVARGPRRLGIEVQGALVSPTAYAYSRTFSRPTAYTSGA